MNTTELIENEIKRIQSFGGNLYNGKATVGAVANHILQKIKAGDVKLPCSPEVIVENTFLEGWFINAFYYYAIAELCALEGLVFKENTVSTGEKYQEILEWSNNFEENRLEKVKEYEIRSKVYEEGRNYIMETSIPHELHHLLQEYPRTGIRINRSNSKKRVTVGAKVWVEFGKRHAYFDSKISNKKEYATFSRYVVATVKHLDTFNLIVEINEKDYKIEMWRVSHVIPEKV